MDESRHWSSAAASYEDEFIDPYRSDVKNPLPRVLRRLADPAKIAADLGCGIGPLLPVLAKGFRHVYGVDFAEGMLSRARELCRDLKNVTLLHQNLTNLDVLAGKIDGAVAG